MAALFAWSAVHYITHPSPPAQVKGGGGEQSARQEQQGPRQADNRRIGTRIVSGLIATDR